MRSTTTRPRRSGLKRAACPSRSRCRRWALSLALQPLKLLLLALQLLLAATAVLLLLLSPWAPPAAR